MGEKISKPLIQAALGQKPSRYPVWFMRQAGRYLPEYREVRKKIEFLKLCQNPKLAAEVTLQPLERFDLDAAIIFSDILIPPVAMGQSLTFDTGHGPILQKPVRSSEDVAALKVPDVKKTVGYVGEAIELTKAKLKPHQTMIGFAGAPFTVASYMVEGSASKNFLEVKKFIMNDTSAYEDLMQKLTAVTIAYLKMQISAGAEVVMLFDSWANQLAPEDYLKYAYKYVKEIISQIKPTGTPVIYYPGQDFSRLMELGDCPADVISIDWRCRLDKAIEALKSTGNTASVQGNLDPLLLTAPEEKIRQSVREIVAQAKKARGHIFNVGHGLVPQTPVSSLSTVIDELRKVTR